MFRQIKVASPDAEYQRIVWRSDPREKLQDYRLLTVTYGTACAPYLAVRTVQQLARDEKASFPKASEVILRDFYVDDLLTGAESIQEAKTLVRQLNTLLEKGGFRLRKWLSNQSSAISELPQEQKGNSNLEFESKFTVKLLGLQWNPDQDTFNMEMNVPTAVNSKRQLLSHVARIFDPLGFLSPATIWAKILIQELWSLELSWDDPLPESTVRKWNRFALQLPVLTQVQIPRFLMHRDSAKSIQVHGFSDASQKAYAAVVYLRTESNAGQVEVNLMAAKTRVAPAKTVSLPRLELCAAVLLSNLYASVTKDTLVPKHEAFLWTDSQIVLDWIRSDPHKWKPFISNRIVVIHSNTTAESWHHVSSHDNPADCASRGILPRKLVNHPMWWNGPAWLQSACFLVPSSSEASQVLQDAKEEESKVLTYATQVQEEPEFIHRYSTLSRTTRVIAWCYRFMYNASRGTKERTMGPLKAWEIKQATMSIVKVIQRSAFSKEIDQLKYAKVLPSSSKLLPLNPFLDVNKVLRVGGRLQNAAIASDQKFPMLLPHHHHFTDLIIDHYHVIALHGGTQVVLSLIRQKYWFTSGRDTVRRRIGKCITCFRTRGAKMCQIMGNLPKERVVPAKPFENTGVDFAGPITTKPNLKRSKVTLKSYIAVFVCLATKAVHLEVVSDLSTEAFLASFRRFISRRGLPSRMFSDNATNFQGAKNYLKGQQQICEAEQVQDFMANRSIEWNFIPPASPHFGGLWEANIKSMKSHLVKVCKSSILNFEELTTLITQIEACLNSRPMTPVSADPKDLQTLTPGHFLVGSPILALPELSPTQQHAPASRWKHIQALRQQFWDRWSTDYLSQLQTRAKWRKSTDNVHAGQLVLIKEDNRPPLQWRIAKVNRTFPGSDGQVRVVEVQTPTGVTKRAITKLCLLPLSEEVSSHLALSSQIKSTLDNVQRRPGVMVGCGTHP